MNITEIAFTSYAIEDVPRARRFYEEVLGLKPSSVFEDGDMAFIEYQVGPHTLSIGKGADHFRPGVSGAAVAFEVADFEASIQKLRGAKTKFLMEPMDTSACRMALILDPDGNPIMIHKRKQA